MYDPLVVDTFIRAFDEIAPAAIKAGQLAKSITPFHEDHARLESGRARHQTRPLVHISSAFNSARERLVRSASVDDALTDALFLAREFTPASVCAWFEYQHDRDAYRCARVFGDSGQLLRGLVIRNGERVTGWAGANGQTAANSDAVLDLGPLAQLFTPTLLSTVSCPIRVAGATPGVLTVYSTRQEGFASTHVDVLQQISESLAMRLKSKGPSEVLI
jgi:hypothetical protein